MNLSKLMGNKKAAYAILERRTKSTTTSCINDNANIEINAETAIVKLENLKKKFSGKNTIRGLYTELREALGFSANTNNNSSNNNSDDDVSQYGFVNIVLQKPQSKTSKTKKRIFAVNMVGQCAKPFFARSHVFLSCNRV